MTVALRSPTLVDSLISVDNAPVDAALSNDFAKYIRGMRRIEESRMIRQSEADEILKEYEEVRFHISSLLASLLSSSISLSFILRLQSRQ